MSIVKAVEGPGQLDEVKDDAVRLALRGGLLDYIGKARQLANQVLLLGARRSRSTGRRILGGRQASRLAPDKETADARMCVLHVENGIFRRLLLGKIEIEVELASRPFA